MKSSKNNFLYITALIITILGAFALYAVRSISSAGKFAAFDLVWFVVTITALTSSYFVLKRYHERMWKVSKYVISACVICLCIVIFVVTADSIILFVLVNVFVILLVFTAQHANWLKLPRVTAYILIFSSCAIFLTLHVWNIIGSRQMDVVFNQIKTCGYMTSAGQANKMYEEAIDYKKNGGATVVALSHILASNFQEATRSISFDEYNDHMIFTNPKIRDILQKMLLKHSKELEMLEHSLSYPQLIAPLHFPEQLYSMPLPHLSSLSETTKLLKYKFHYEIYQNEPQKALKTLNHIFKICEILEFEPMLISQLVKAAIEKRTFVAIGEAIRYVDDLQVLQQLIKFIESRCEYKAFNFEFELIYLCNIFSEVEKTTFFQSNVDIQSALGISFLKFLPRGFVKQDAAYGLQHVLRNISLSKRGEKAVRDSFYGKEEMNDWYPISGIVTIYFRGINMKNINLLAIARCVFSALHLRLQQLQSQQVNFAEIKKKYPLYTTDPFTGESLLNTSTADGYVIYSVGEDLKNGGGIITRRGDTGVLLRKEK